MPCWLWSDAPAVSAFLSLAKRTSDPALREQYQQAAVGIGEVFLRTQVRNPDDEIYGALVSRFRYYGKTTRSFHELCGMNDTSFSVKWALLPLYQYTGERKYLDASRLALDWVEKNARILHFVPSHYYHEDKVWENRAFVDTGFCPEGFSAYAALEKNQGYENTACFLMERFLSQFRLPGGFFGQNYIPGQGVDNRLFTRGQAWVLEGLLACFRMTHNDIYINEAKNLARLLMRTQRNDGCWPYLLGYGEPQQAELEGSGICEKATAVLSYIFTEMYQITDDDSFRITASKAVHWCENNMVITTGEGYGGIMARSLSSGITGLPFLDVATGYANAFYILAKDMLER
jgi:rhamnogalacturonyl hydrolase YesR